MAKVVRRSSAETDDLALTLTEFRTHRDMAKEIDNRISTLKTRIMAALERRGEPDEKGSLWIQLDPPVAGFSAIKRERRAKVRIDEQKAERILKDKNVWDECTDVHIAIDGIEWPIVRELLAQSGWTEGDQYTVEERLCDDKVTRLFYDEQNKPEPVLTTEDLDAMFREDISWALVPKDAD